MYKLDFLSCDFRQALNKSRYKEFSLEHQMKVKFQQSTCVPQQHRSDSATPKPNLPKVAQTAQSPPHESTDCPGEYMYDFMLFHTVTAAPRLTRLFW